MVADIFCSSLHMKYLCLGHLNTVNFIYWVHSNAADFPKYLAVAIAGLLRAFNDIDSDVRLAADESLNRCINVSTDSLVLYRIVACNKAGRITEILFHPFIYRVSFGHIKVVFRWSYIRRSKR